MSGIYIHIPFCKQACSYCNFYFSISPGNKKGFVAALSKEIELSKDYLENDKIETIYLGGGTPSQLHTDDLKQIVEQLSHNYNLSDLKEFTIEANPDDLTKEKVEEMRSLQQFGFSRFSIGVQSFLDEDLKYMNRAHNSDEALASIKRVQDAGFENLTIDLIYGTPSLSDIQWKRNLEIAFSLQVPHISSYALTVEPKTTLALRIKKGETEGVSEEQTSQQFKILMKEMRTAGYEHYEISNFAKPGKHAVHNSNYWLGKKYLGLGPSAHSYNGHSRRWNVSNNVDYINSIRNGKILFEEEMLTSTQKVNERIMTSIRTQWGLKIADCGLTFSDLIQNNLKQVEPTFYTFENGVVKLTDAGKLFADSIATQLFIDEE